MNAKLMVCLIMAFLFYGCAGNKTDSICVNSPSDTVYVYEKERPLNTQTPVVVDSPAQGKVVYVPTVVDCPSPQVSCDCAPVSMTLDSTTKKDFSADPYQVFPAMVEEVFSHVDSLYRAGNVDQATSYLKRFRVIKPLWTQWESRADSLLNVYGTVRAKNAKQFESFVLQIQNMNRVQSAYSLVASVADSLIALAPGDSLIAWANKQKQQAYSNTLSKAQKEFDDIKALADDQGQFAAAKAKVLDFQKRYRDFEDSLHIQEFIEYVNDLILTVDPAAIKYWESHDPVKALAEADTLISRGDFKKAKDLLNKLKASSYRKAAKEKYINLADAYCSKQRKQTSQYFSKAQSQPDASKKKALLNDAIESLNRCLEEYPESSHRQKVLENKEFLEKELHK